MNFFSCNHSTHCLSFSSLPLSVYSFLLGSLQCSLCLFYSVYIGFKDVNAIDVFFYSVSGIRPHAVKKRTPRVPVAYSSDKDNNRNYVSPARQGLKPSVDTKNDDVANEIALALTEASHRGDSPLVSWKSKRKAKGTPPTVRNGEMMVRLLFKRKF